MEITAAASNFLMKHVRTYIVTGTQKATGGQTDKQAQIILMHTFEILPSSRKWLHNEAKSGPYF